MREEIEGRIRNLNFQQIFTFFGVVECGNLTKAAEGLNMSQAAVSRIIASLERETNLILFLRESRGMTPTPAGKILYRYWKDSLQGFNEGYLEAVRVQKGFIKNMSLGTIDKGQSMFYHIELLNWFEQCYPDSKLKITYGNTDDLRTGLLAEQFHVICVNYFETEHLKTLGAKCKLLAEKPCSIYVHDFHPLFQKESLSCEDLKGYDLTVFGTLHMAQSRKMREVLKKCGMTLENLQVEPDYKKAVLSYARKTGLFFSEGIFEGEKMKDFRRIPLEISSGIAAVWLDEQMGFFVRDLHQYVQNIK